MRGKERAMHSYWAYNIHDIGTFPCLQWCSLSVRTRVLGNHSTTVTKKTICRLSNFLAPYCKLYTYRYTSG